MSQNTFMDKIRTFFGLRQEPPRNDFRNPIWGTDDDDDGDELYTRQNITQYDPADIHRELAKQMNDIFKSFGSIFGDMRSFFHDDQYDNFAGFGDIPSEPENYSTNNIRDYYLKPGYHNQKFEQPKQDIDLDGKISSNEISGLLKQKEDKANQEPPVSFNGDLVPGRSFCKTIITTSVTKPDGSIETRRIVKSGNGVVEETITSTEPDAKGTYNTGLDSVINPGIVYQKVLSDLSSIFRNFY